jgi:hypothetical protein
MVCRQSTHNAHPPSFGGSPANREPPFSATSREIGRETQHTVSVGLLNHTLLE